MTSRSSYEHKPFEKLEIGAEFWFRGRCFTKVKEQASHNQAVNAKDERGKLWFFPDHAQISVEEKENQGQMSFLEEFEAEKEGFWRDVNHYTGDYA